MSQRLIKSHFIWIYFFAIFLQCNSSVAKDFANTPFLIKNIEISASGRNPNEARNNANLLAQRNAFLAMLSRLAMDESAANVFSNEEISDMVSTRQILGEKIAGNNYFASYNIGFSEEFVKHHLGDRDFSKDLAKIKTYLVLPIKIQGNEQLLWQKNDWKLAWDSAINLKHYADNKNILLKLPAGDVYDLANINENIIQSGNFSNFSPIAEKDKADGVIIAYYIFDSIENKVNITLKTLKKFETINSRLSFVNIGHLSAKELVEKVTSKTINYISGGTRASSKKVQSDVEKINIDIFISNLGDWIRVKDKLENNQIIKKMKVNSISKDVIKISGVYERKNGNIINFFLRKNLPLIKKDKNQYTMSFSSFSVNSISNLFH
jgi:hypothetical protein